MSRESMFVIYEIYSFDLKTVPKLSNQNLNQRGAAASMAVPIKPLNGSFS
jgi:hypothetical protein